MRFYEFGGVGDVMELFGLDIRFDNNFRIYYNSCSSYNFYCCDFLRIKIRKINLKDR